MAFMSNELGRHLLGARVGYRGASFAPVPGTYPGIDAANFGYFSVDDSGIPDGSIAMRSLAPLVAAALYEVGFAWEFGPLSTWSN